MFSKCVNVVHQRFHKSARRGARGLSDDISEVGICKSSASHASFVPSSLVAEKKSLHDLVDDVPSIGGGGHWWVHTRRRCSHPSISLYPSRCKSPCCVGCSCGRPEWLCQIEARAWTGAGPGCSTPPTCTAAGASRTVRLRALRLRLSGRRQRSVQAAVL